MTRKISLAKANLGVKSEVDIFTIKYIAILN